MSELTLRTPSAVAERVRSFVLASQSPGETSHIEGLGKLDLVIICTLLGGAVQAAVKIIAEDDGETFEDGLDFLLHGLTTDHDLFAMLAVMADHVDKIEGS